MANKSLFNTRSTGSVPEADTLNEAGGVAYSLDDKAALAQLVCTGTFHDTFYANASSQLDSVLALTKNIPTEFIAKAAIYARHNAYMKDSPAILCAVLACRDVTVLHKVFTKVIDNGKMLKNFVQIIRSGVTGRKSMGTAVKRLVQHWLTSRTDEQLFKDIVGNDPSLADVIKMVHPTAKNAKQNTMFAYICGNLEVNVNIETGKVKSVYNNYRGNKKKVNKSDVPEIIARYEIFKKMRLAGKDYKIPDVPFQMISSFNMKTEEWTEMAKNGQWMFTRMNLNNFNKNGVFNNDTVTDMICNRLSDPIEVKKARAFPYQLLTTFKNTGDIPTKVSNALQDAMEIAIDNVPSLNQKVYVLVDVSGSMSCPVTGYRSSATSDTTCIDVAALFAAAILRKNQDAEVIPFDTTVHNDHKLNPRDSVMTNATILSNFCGGGTDCSCAIKYLNENKAKGDLIIMISDNMSWCNSIYYCNRGTNTRNEFNVFKNRNPNAKMICIDIQASTSTQIPETSHSFNIGGFSDQVFNVIEAYANDKLCKGYFVKEIENVTI